MPVRYVLSVKATKGISVHLTGKVNLGFSGADRSWCVEIVMAGEPPLYHRRLTAFRKEIHDVRTPWRM